MRALVWAEQRNLLAERIGRQVLDRPDVAGAPREAVAFLTGPWAQVMAHARLELAVESWKHRFPDVDIILIEPEMDDELMFGTSILDYASRLKIARHGFESVTSRLARELAAMEETDEKKAQERILDILRASAAIYNKDKTAA